MSSLYFPFQISKLVTWEVVLSVGAVFGLLFGYERLTWTDSAKERAIKEQVGRLVEWGGGTGVSIYIYLQHLKDVLHPFPYM